MSTPPRISFPPDIAVEIYYYYSSLTLFLSWLLCPFLTYVILTQSKQMTSFKWFILNHCFWCLAFETLIGLLKPVLLPPAFAGYSIGILKHLGSYYVMTLAMMFAATCAINACIGLIVTILSRYLMVFPSSLTDWFTMKLAIGMLICLMIICNSFEVFIGIRIASNGSETNSKLAVTLYPDLEEYTSLPSFIFNSSAQYSSKIFFILDLTITIAGILFIIFFIYLIQIHRTTATVSRFQRSLIISSILQVGITGIFLVLPLMVFVGTVAFDISNMGTIMVIVWSLMSTHCFVEFLVTLFFISPYRKFIIQKFRKSIKVQPQRSEGSVLNSPIFATSVVID